MEQESNLPANARSKNWPWLLIAFIGLFAVMGICLVLVLAGAFLLRSRSMQRAETTPFIQTSPAFPNIVTVPAIQAIPTSMTVPVAPSKTAVAETLPTLDDEADPFYGSARLERGTFVDPFILYVEPGGPVDTAKLGLDCGLTSSAPTFKFNLSGGAHETFLRIFFTVPYELDTTLVVHTPNNEWLCNDNSSYGNGRDPVIDMEYAPSGDYAIWVGAHQSETYGPGSLYITRSAEITP